MSCHSVARPRRLPRAVALDPTLHADDSSRFPRPAVLAWGSGASSMSGSERVTPKRLHVITWGCQMNVYDSGRMADVLAPLGYAPVATPEAADMVILNTCHIRDRAAEKVFSELGRLRRLKDASDGRMI